MRIVKRYIAEDGTEFTTQNDCELYEKKEKEFGLLGIPEPCSAWREIEKHFAPVQIGAHLPDHLLAIANPVLKRRWGVFGRYGLQQTSPIMET